MRVTAALISMAMVLVVGALRGPRASAATAATAATRLLHVVDAWHSYAILETLPPGALPPADGWRLHLFGHGLGLYTADERGLEAPKRFTVVGEGGVCVARATKSVVIGAAIDDSGSVTPLARALELHGCRAGATGERIAIEGERTDVRWTAFAWLPSDLPEFYDPATVVEPKSGPLADARRWLRAHLATHPPVRGAKWREAPLTLSVARAPGLDVDFVTSALALVDDDFEAMLADPDAAKGPFDVLRVVRSGKLLGELPDTEAVAVLHAGASEWIVLGHYGMDLQVFAIEGDHLVPVLARAKWPGASPTPS